MRWEINGADRQTGKDVRVELEADSESDAVRAPAVRALFVREVRRVPQATIDYSGPRPVAALPSLEAVSAAAGEPIYFDGNGIQVTASRIVLPGATYALRNVTSVQVASPKPWWRRPAFFLVAICAPVVFVSLMSRQHSLAVPFVVLTIAGVVVSLIPARRVATIRLVSGETAELGRAEYPPVQAAVCALNQALIDRG